MITTYNNVLNPLDRTILTNGNYKNIDEILKELKYDNEIYDLVISKNSIIQEGFFEVSKGDIVNITIVPKGGGGGGKKILGIVASIAIAIVSAGAGAAYGAALANSAFGVAVGMSAGVGAALIGVGVALAGNLLLSAIMPRPNMSVDFNNQDFKHSNTYSWNRPTNQALQSAPVPKIFGTHKITPPLISSYIESIDDKQFFNGLYALNDGEILGVSSIKINNEPIENFTDVRYEMTDGKLSQSLIVNFNDTRYDKGVNKKLNPNKDYVLAQTDGNFITSLSVTLLMPKGLFYANDKGSLDEYSIKVRVEYSKDKETWKPMLGLSEAEVEQWGKPPANFESMIEIRGGRSNRHFYYSDPNYGAQYRHHYNKNELIKEIKAWYKQRAGNLGSVIKAKQSSPLRKTIKVTGLEPSKYYIRARFEDTPKTSNRHASDCYLEYITETISDDFIYPKTALLAVRALATDQLSGSIPTVSCSVSANSNNPAKVAKQILLDSGVLENQILDSFNEWESFCDKKGFECNIVFDSELSVRKALDTVSILGRASILQVGSKFDVLIEKAEIVPVQSFMFGMGNILSGTFRQNFLPLVDRANFLEITYYDKNRDYEPSIVSVTSQNIDSSRLTSKTSVTLVGCTNEEQARKYGEFQLNCNRYLTETIEFEADKDSLVCRYGDIIKVSHDTPQYGFSGRLATNSENNTITLDRDIELEHGKRYAIQIKNDINEIYEFEVIEALGSNILRANLNGKTFKQYDNYAFGEIGKVSKLYRIIKISTGGEFTRHITAIEYNEDIYNDSPIISNSDFSSLGISNLRANDYLIINNSVKTMVDVAWRGSSLHYVLNYKKVGEPGGKTIRLNESNFSFEALDAQTYEISVSDSFGNRAQIYHKVVGKLAPPPAVSNLKAVELRDYWSLSWGYDDAPLDFKEFEIYENGKIAAKSHINKIDIPKNRPSGVFAVFAVDSSNIKSEPMDISVSVKIPAAVDNFNSVYKDNKNIALWDSNEQELSYEIRKGASWDKGYSVYQGSDTSAELPTNGVYLIKHFYINRYGLRVESEDATALVIDEAVLKANIIENISHPNWSGQKTSLQEFSGSLYLSTNIPLSAGFDATKNVDNLENVDLAGAFVRHTASLIGYYDCRKVVTLNSPKLCNISSFVNTEIMTLSNLFDMFENVDEIQNIDGVRQGVISATIQISISQDGTNFTDFKTFRNGEYIGKAFKFRLKLQSKDKYYTPKITKWDISVDMPDIIESGTASSLSNGATQISFKNNFSIIPKTQITIIDAQSGDDAILQNQTKDGFMIKIINKQGIPVSREFNYITKGY